MVKGSVFLHEEDDMVDVCKRVCAHVDDRCQNSGDNYTGKQHHLDSLRDIGACSLEDQQQQQEVMDPSIL